MDCLYHYCSNNTCFSILSNQSIRLSDIQKSNDYNELSLFFPALLNEIERQYKESPFHFYCDGLTGDEAFSKLMRDSYFYWRGRFANGDFSNFVICFSEYPDVLSQWRGYADDGRGCCLGFSKRVLDEYCDRYKSVFRIEKVAYLMQTEIHDFIKGAATTCLEKLKTLREWCVEHAELDYYSQETDSFLHFNFDSMLEVAFLESLKFKSQAFFEENEWRIFFRKPAYKNPNWICREDVESLTGPEGFAETVRYLSNKIEFRITENDIIPFVPIAFDELTENPIKEIWTGPKNKVREMDLALYLRQKGFSDTQLFHSGISYC